MIVPDDFLEKLLEEVGKAEEAQRKARASNRPIAILTPIVPIRFDETDSWFGGKPKLPKDVPWPEEDGQPFRFACQINLRNLPRGIWSGAGPREGWLVVFLHWDMPKAKVLHVRGELEERDGPGQMSAQWARTYEHTASITGEHWLPRWPIRIKEVRQNHQGDTTTSNTVEGWDPIKPDLIDPGFHPFDAPSLSVLLECLGKHFDWQAKGLEDIHLKMKIRNSDFEWIDRNAVSARESLNAFVEARSVLANSLKRFDQTDVSLQLTKIANLPTYELECGRNDEEGFRILNYRTARLASSSVLSNSSPVWWATYTGQFYWMCINAYTKNPQTLPPAVRRRMEQVWTDQTGQFHGAMGHAPTGHMYETYGPDSDTEVLLELPTSLMQGWIWGDCYSIVLLIKRQALDQGDFSAVEGIITNP